ncbi:MAG: O-antigen ligase family protein [Planctomycetota bacterium]
MSAPAAAPALELPPPPLRRFTIDPWLTTVPERLIAFQILCQLALLVGALGPLRLFIRAATFGSSTLLLAYLLLTRRPKTMHPSAKAGLVVVLVLLLGLAHPETNTLTAALAQITMYVSILAPLFWVACCRCSADVLRRVLLILLAFHTLSSLFGVLQAYFPGSFRGALAFDAGGQYTIKLASGQRVYRLMGLTDAPGGAATSGFYAVLIGTAFLVSERARWPRVLAFLGIVLGMFCLYLAQSRSRFVMTGICATSLLALMAYRGQLRRLAVALVLGVTAVLGAFGWAQAIGGEAATERLSTLVTSDPGQLYYKNRGTFLERTLKEQLPENPLGAGLGRWGMMFAYFGSASASRPIFAEIQLTGWVLDGGLPLVLAYGAALLAAFWVAWRLATRTSTDQPLWLFAGLVFAYDLGALAMSFSYPIFMSQQGMELWLLNAVLFDAYLDTRRAA